jgi:hypothetical protein
MFPVVKYCLSKVTDLFVWRFLFFSFCIIHYLINFILVKWCKLSISHTCRLLITEVGSHRFDLTTWSSLGKCMFIFSNVLHDRAICHFLYYKNRWQCNLCLCSISCDLVSTNQILRKISIV